MATRMTVPLAILSVVTSGVALALSVYLNVYRERRIRPRLSIAPDGLVQGVDLVTLQYETEPGCVEHWARLRVHNEKHRRTAEDVEVLFIGCSADGDTTTDLALDWRRLRWAATAETTAGTDVLSRTAQKPDLTATIPPGFFRHIDVLHASNRDKVDEDVRSVPRLCVWPTPSKRNVITHGQFKLFFAITAKDANTAFYCMPLRYDGQWSDSAEAWWGRHLRLEPPYEIDQEQIPGGG